jgi:hypothetical protein
MDAQDFGTVVDGNQSCTSNRQLFPGVKVVERVLHRGGNFGGDRDSEQTKPIRLRMQDR